MIITRQLNPTEIDLLTGHEFDDVVFTSLNEEEFSRIKAPASGWTHDALEVLPANLEDDAHKSGWNAYFCNNQTRNWIGSSEV